MSGGRFDFDDGGTYCGGWEDGKAHGHGVCTGPKRQGEYAGSWHFGFEVSGVYRWPSGSQFEGQWQNGKRHGLGVESRGRWAYRGEWTQGFKGRYGVRQSLASPAKYEGTWANGLQDGYGSETYADGGTFQGQWMRGMRHGYGVRTSASFGAASHLRPAFAERGSLQSVAGDPLPGDRDCRGGFVLKSRSDERPPRRRSLAEKSTSLKKSILSGLKIKKQRSTGDIDRRGISSSSMRSSGSNLSSASSESEGLREGSVATEVSNASFVSQDELCDTQVTETYMGEWKNDKRCGFGIAERSDGLKYEGEWYNNKKYGYGVTTLRDGLREEGKYKNNVLVSTGKRRHLFGLRSGKFRDRVEGSLNGAAKASQLALQKADIAISRTATSRGKAEQADLAALHAQEDANVAKHIAKQYDPDIVISAELPKSKYSERMNSTMRLPLGSLSPENTPTSDSRYANQIPYKQHNSIPHPQERYQEQQPQDRYPHPQERYQQPQERYLQPQERYPQPQQDRYQQQQDRYHQPQERHPQSQERYPQPQERYPQQQDRYQQPQERYAQSQERYPQVKENRYPQQAQYPTAVPQQPGYSDTSYFPSHQPSQPGFLGDPPPVPHRQGSFRRRQQGSLQQGDFSGDHFEHYSPKSVVIKGRRRIPSPAGRRGVAQAPDATPDSGISELGDEISLGRPPLIYTQGSHASSMMSFAPSEITEDRRSPALSSVGSEIGSEAAFPRTASLYVNPPSRQRQAQQGAVREAALRRKQSMPHKDPGPQRVIPREEVAVLSSQRREEVRRIHTEAERLRANPLLYLVRPDFKDWFSRQQMILLVLIINISLAVMFYKLLS